MTARSRRSTGPTTSFTRALGMKQLSALTAALAFGSVVGTGVIAADLAGTAATTASSGSSTGTAVTSSTEGDDGATVSTAVGGSQVSVSAGSGSSHATSGGS